MGRKTDRVRALYLGGIRDGDLAAVDRYTDGRYVQHSAGVPDGATGFKSFFQDFLTRHPRREIELLRIFEDGPYAFAHAYQRLDDGAAEWVTMDLFLFDDDDLIVEHWDCIDAYVGPLTSGRTQVDGPREPTDLDRTEANKAIVRELLATVFQAGADYQLARRFISGTTYLQHSDGLPDGVDALISGLASMRQAGREVRYDIRRMVGYGSFVAALSSVLIGGEERAAFDLFRLEDGAVVEHWDVVEVIGPRSTWNNSGKF